MNNSGRTRGNQSGTQMKGGRMKSEQANTQPLPEASPNV